MLPAWRSCSLHREFEMWHSLLCIGSLIGIIFNLIIPLMWGSWDWNSQHKMGEHIGLISYTVSHLHICNNFYESIYMKRCKVNTMYRASIHSISFFYTEFNKIQPNNHYCLHFRPQWWWIEIHTHLSSTLRYKATLLFHYEVIE